MTDLILSYLVYFISMGLLAGVFLWVGKLLLEDLLWYRRTEADLLSNKAFSKLPKGSKSRFDQEALKLLCPRYRGTQATCVIDSQELLISTSLESKSGAITYILQFPPLTDQPLAHIIARDWRSLLYIVAHFFPTSKACSPSKSKFRSPWIFWRVNKKLWGACYYDNTEFTHAVEAIINAGWNQIVLTRNSVALCQTFYGRQNLPDLEELRDALKNYNQLKGVFNPR